MSFHIQSNFQYFVASLLVRFKLLKKASVEITDIQKVITSHLPVSFDVPIPGGDGELNLLDITLCLNNRDSVSAKILCNFSVKIKKSIIYNSHVQVDLDAKPDYCQSTKTISPTDFKVISLKLISDKHSVIKDTSKIIAGILPEPLKTMFITTLLSTGVVLDSIGISELARYLSLYLTGSKQRILDFHHLDIEKIIINYAKSESLAHHLDETDLEERLFAKYGVEMAVQNEHLYCFFDPE